LDIGNATGALFLVAIVLLCVAVWISDRKRMRKRKRGGSKALDRENMPSRGSLGSSGSNVRSVLSAAAPFMASSLLHPRHGKDGASSSPSIYNGEEADFRYDSEYEEACEQGMLDAENGEDYDDDGWQNGYDDAWQDGYDEGYNDIFPDESGSDGWEYRDDDLDDE